MFAFYSMFYNIFMRNPEEGNAPKGARLALRAKKNLIFPFKLLSFCSLYAKIFGKRIP